MNRHACHLPQKLQFRPELRKDKKGLSHRGVKRKVRPANSTLRRPSRAQKTKKEALASFFKLSRVLPLSNMPLEYAGVD